MVSSDSKTIMKCKRCIRMDYNQTLGCSHRGSSSLEYTKCSSRSNNFNNNYFNKINYTNKSYRSSEGDTMFSRLPQQADMDNSSRWGSRLLDNSSHWGSSSRHTSLLKMDQSLLPLPQQYQDNNLNI